MENSSVYFQPFQLSVIRRNILWPTNENTCKRSTLEKHHRKDITEAIFQKILKEKFSCNMTTMSNFFTKILFILKPDDKGKNLMTKAKT